MEKVIINFCPTGAIPQKAMSPHVPVSCNEIVDCVLEACEIGITVVHLHARDQVTYRNTSNPDVFMRIIDGIRKHAPELVICVSLTARHLTDAQLRDAPLGITGKLKPDMASLTLASVDFVNDTNTNTLSEVTELAWRMKERGIVPELEVFDTGMMNVASYLIRKGFIDVPAYVNVILGNIATAQADLGVLDNMLKHMPIQALWSVGGIGSSQLAMNAVAIAIGGGVRVGVEDNLWLDVGRTQLAKNADLLRRIHSISGIHMREVMPSSEFRTLLRMKKGFGEYGR